MPELQNISKSFGQNHVLSGINMTFEQGQTDTLVGGNGQCNPASADIQGKVQAAKTVNHWLWPCEQCQLVVA